MVTRVLTFPVATLSVAKAVPSVAKAVPSVAKAVPFLGALLLLSLGPATTCQGQTKPPTLDLTFDDIKFEIEEDEPFSRDHLTPEINDLQGKKISLRGFILPNGTSATGNRKFILVRDNQECCFGPGAALYDCVLVKLAKDHTVDFTVRPVMVEGTFKVKELRIGGQIMAIYRMYNCKVSQ